MAGRGIPESWARLGNVTGALFLTQMRDSAVDRESAGSVADCFDGLFEETLLVGGTPPSHWPGARVRDPRGEAGELHSWLAAWEACTSDRLVWTDSDEAGRCAELVLALTAWPESDAVIVSDAAGKKVLCGVLRRDQCVSVAHAVLETGEASRSAFLAALESSGDVQRLSVDRLGLSDWQQCAHALGGAM